MATDTDPALDVLTDVVRERAQAEAREIAAMLGYRDDELARTVTVEPPMRRLVERSAIALTIGEATGLSEAQVQLRLSAAGTVREQLQRPESVERLDRLVVGYAVGHTGAELRQWLRRFVQRVEADLAIERADDERANRHVSIKHTDDSMAWLNAYLPSHEAAAIEARLRREARRAVDPDDPRTVAQREADLLVAWCTGADAATSAADANIAVTIGADVLAGANPGLAQSTDGRWAVPAQWVTDLARTGNLFWHRIITEPITGDVLSHEYLGLSDHRPSAARQAPGRSPAATKSLKRRGTSRAPHRQPWPEGPTRADNLGPLCRRHHQMKGHGILRWTTRPAKGPPPLVIEIYSSPVSMEYAG